MFLIMAMFTLLIGLRIVLIIGNVLGVGNFLLIVLLGCSLGIVILLDILTIVMVLHMITFYKCIDALQDPHCNANGTVFLDGTFQTAPQGFEQTWIVRSSLYNESLGTLNFLAAYALLQNKTAVTYHTVLEELKTAAPLWSPRSFVCDFEVAEHNAIRQSFPNCPIHGCHFHYCKCVLKQFRKLGPCYRDDDYLRALLHSLYALPFVPTDNVTLTWNALSAQLSYRYPTVAGSILPYFTNTWMDGNYPLEMWNCYTRTLTNFPRTNNISEGSNNAIRAHFGCSNPTVWACITKIKELQSSTDLDLTQFYTHRWTSPSVCRKVKERDDRILSMVRDYNRTDVLNYTRRLGHMFSM